MGLNATVTPSKVWAQSGDPITIAKLNLTANPVVAVDGNLNQLNNVSNASPGNAQPLVYNTSTQKWEPGIVAVAYLGAGNPVATNSSNVFANLNFY